MGEDLKSLVRFIKKLGELNDAGQFVVKFGVLFDDIHEAEDTIEGLYGILEEAKQRKIIRFKGMRLLKGTHDNISITLLKEQTEHKKSKTNKLKKGRARSQTMSAKQEIKKISQKKKKIKENIPKQINTKNARNRSKSTVTPKTKKNAIVSSPKPRKNRSKSFKKRKKQSKKMLSIVSSPKPKRKRKGKENKLKNGRARSQTMGAKKTSKNSD